MKQPEALRLADWLEASKLPYDPADVGEAAAELRRLHEVNADLLESLQDIAEAGAEAWGEARPCVSLAFRTIAKVKGQQ